MSQAAAGTGKNVSSIPPTRRTEGKAHLQTIEELATDRQALGQALFSMRGKMQQVKPHLLGWVIPE